MTFFVPSSLVRTNKLECLSREYSTNIDLFSNPVHLTMLKNIRHGLSGTNTVAYLSSVSVTKKKVL
jgi:hypothetical protein